MLTSLSIRNVVLIEALDLDFETGLTALTGETGAGKSIILDALGMATGARSDKSLVRAGTDKAQCTAYFHIQKEHPVWPVLEEAGLEVEAGELILRRLINRDGRSRAFVNDEAISVKLLSRIGQHVLEVHGQHDGRGLLDPAEHIRMLDAYGGYDDLINKCRSSFIAMKTAVVEYEELKVRAEKSAKDRDDYEHAIAELDRLDVQADEDMQLAQERRFLQGAEGALSELSAAEAALGEQGSFEDRLAVAIAGIDRVKSKFGPDDTHIMSVIEQAAEALDKAMIEMQEARDAVSKAAQIFDVEPGRLDNVERRLFSIRAAARKYETDVAGLPAKRQALSEALEALDTIDQKVEEAQKTAQHMKATYLSVADRLSKAREKAARLLDKAVAGELSPLKLEGARFVTQIERINPSISGQDRVVFEVSTNPGSPLGPLNKIASGGELSRFSLAIKVALHTQTGSVMVFDEVDQGVGGAVANAVGKRLQSLSNAGQLFVVTHSPQVAACATHQFRIEKSSTGVTTTTQVTRVDDRDREEEIARMLAGETITQEARAAARKLMKAS